MKNRYLILKIIVFFVIILTITLNISFGMSVSDLNGGNREQIESLNTIGNKTITVISTIGSVISVIVIIVIGLKYMIGSVEEKAEYKKTLMPFLIGALFVFAASTIASIIYNIAINI